MEYLSDSTKFRPSDPGNNVVEFTGQHRDRVEVIAGTDKKTGRPIWLFDLVEADGRCIIQDCHSKPEAIAAAKKLKADGYHVVWSDALGVAKAATRAHSGDAPERR